MREIIEVELAGHSGPHQFGFTRYARVTLDCGHTATERYMRAGDSSDKHRCAEDETPQVGQMRPYCKTCRPAARPAENLTPEIPGITNHAPWGRWGRVEAAVGLGDIYQAAWADPEFNALASRLCGGTELIVSEESRAR